MVQKRSKEELFADRYTRVYVYYLALFFIIALAFGGTFLYQRVFQSEELYIQPTQKFFVEEIKIQKGDNLYQILSPFEISDREIHTMIKVVKPKINLAKLKINQLLWIRYSESLEGERTPISMTLEVDQKSKIKINLEDQTYKAEDVKVIFNREIVEVSGTVNGSIINSAVLAGAPRKNVIQMINSYSNKIDFQKEIKKGDKFAMLIEKFVSEDGKNAFFGKTLYSSIGLRSKEFKLYLFKLKNGTEIFLDEKARATKASIMKKPVVEKRISDRFGPRKHPTLGTIRMHNGVDLAAPAGTPIYAGGDGRIINIGRKGAYGKYIKIRHNAKLHTAYAHMKGFAKGLKKNSRVKQGQVIGYVGTTGRSTGPHLHYEVIVNGKFVDPLKIKFTPTKQLTGQQKEDFLKYKEIIDQNFAQEEMHDTKFAQDLKQYTF